MAGQAKTIDRPIFIIGAGRSGSTAVHEILACHPNVAWLSAFGLRYPDSPALNRALLNALDWPILGRYMRRRFKPWECFRYWEHYSTGFRRSCRDLTAHDASQKSHDVVQKALGKLVTKHRTRLMLKATGWPRIGYLATMFPDARFVHVLRDGRSVANSLLSVDWWLGWQGPQNWRYGELDPHYLDEWKRHDRSFVALAGIQWKIIMDAIEEGRGQVNAANIFELRYEELCAEPVRAMREVALFAGLEWTSAFERLVASQSLVSMNHRWRNELTAEQQRILQCVLADKLKRCGYD
jgi:omega-hydroxy-beta-dihydromenaquinone-9 sulfotransferase